MSGPLAPDSHYPLELARRKKMRLLKRASWLFTFPLFVFYSGTLSAQQGSEDIQDATGKYHFLTADDTLALLEEEGKLKGYVEVCQGEEESDALLSYPITIGWRKKDRIEFKTGKIHQKYYRFTGTVQHGAGHEETDPDYLRLVGDLEVVSVRAETGKEFVQRIHAVFKSMGRGERGED